MMDGDTRSGHAPTTATVGRLLRSFLFPLLVLAVYVGLAWGSARWMALTFDEPGHLMGGLAAAREGDFRFGPNHPPLIRYWFSLPNALDPSVAFPVDGEAYRQGRQTSAAIDLMRANDGLALLRRSRFMVVLLAAALGWVVWRWARGLFGMTAGAAALLLFLLEPNLMAHGSLASTDMGITLFFVLAVLALRRVWIRASAGAIAALAVLFACAQLSKFSALALWPAAAVVLAVRALDRSPWDVGSAAAGRRIAGRGRKALLAAGVMLAIVAVFFAAAWGAYRFRYAIAPDPSLAVDFTEDREFGASEEAMGRALGAVRFLPEGYVRGAAQLLTWPHQRYWFAGELRYEPVWWFFPVVLLVKTPTALLALAAVGLWLLVRRRGLRPEGWPALAIPPLVFFAAAIASGQSTGIRHLLPLVPFLLLAAGVASSRLVGRRTGRIALAILGAVTLAEFSLAYPDTISAFNLPSGGPSRGDRWLVDSNLDYGQGMLGLKTWMDAHGVRTINLACHTNLDVANSGYEVYQLIGYTNQRVIDYPRLPGYVAISASVLRGYTGGPGVAALYAPFLRMTPVAVIGNSIRVYWVDKPWWTAG